MFEFYVFKVELEFLFLFEELIKLISMGYRLFVLFILVLFCQFEANNQFSRF
jgi:hypothetical protein